MSRPDRPIVAWLGAVEGDVALVGGKAASLDALARLGFLIPPGFCLTTAAFEAQLGSLPDAARLVAALPDESARDRLAASLIGAAIEPRVGGALGAALVELTRQVEEIGAAPARFAVRSSGIGEDSSAASYAGLHETELGVAPDGVADAIRRCWASLWSPAAVAYRQWKGLDADGGGMAVVVQSLVPADAAAVVFTRHPVTGRTDRLVVTAVRGLGDAMVSGTVTPDTWVVDRATGAAVDYTPGDRAPGQDGAALDPPLLDALTRLVLSVERGFGAPVDVEAAVAGGTWYLLQARPITT